MSHPFETRQSLRYDAFLSYSHAVDGSLAPALQRSLQRFTKPWHRMRALRVFRDQTSLSANPALWSAIERALAISEYFILMASPGAAKSSWVAREVEWWKQHKEHHRLLIVLTDGDLVWDPCTGDFDWRRTTAVPEVLRRTFAEEPRWVDLRWAGEEIQLSPRHPQFRECVADLAATIHGRPKDDLIGEDIHEHRRTLRLARGAAAVLVCLTLLAAAAAVVAVRQRDTAEARARVAMSRQLAAQALADLDGHGQLDRALLLSLQALRTEVTLEAKSALLTGLQRRPQLNAFMRLTRGRGSPVLVFSPNGRMLVSHHAGELTLWDASTRRPVDRLLTKAYVTQAAISPDGRVLAAVSVDPKADTVVGGELILWDVGTHQRLDGLPTEEIVGQLAFSPDGRVLATAGPTGLALWDAQTHKPLGARITEERVTQVAFSPDGRVLAAAGPSGLALWDTHTREPIARPVTDEAVYDMEFAPDGRTIAVLASPAFRANTTTADSAEGAAEKLLVWDVQSQRLSRIVDQQLVESITFSPDGQNLAYGTEAGLFLWDLRANVQELLSKPVSYDAMYDIAFSPDGQTLASASGSFHGWVGGLTLWDVRTRKPIGESLTNDAVYSVAFSPDGQTLASTSSSADVARLVLWDTRARKVLGEPLLFGDVSNVAFSFDGKTLASAGGGGLVLWDVNARKPRGEQVTKEAVAQAAFSPKGEVVATASDSGLVLWNARSHKPVGQPLTNEPMQSVAFSPDGRIVASAGAGGLVLWDAQASQPRGQRLTRDPVIRMAFSPDGRTLAYALRNDVDPGGGLVLWDVRSRKPRGTPLPAYIAMDVAFSPDGRTLASAERFGSTGGGNLTLWSVQSRHPLRSPLMNDWVTSVAFTPDGSTLASNGPALTLWDARTGRSLGNLLNSPANDVAFSPNGEVLASGDENGVVLWDVNLASWRKRACTVANRNLTRAEWKQFIGQDKPYARTCPNLPPG